MKTICPICGFETEVLDEKIRKRGRDITCPRCEHTYFVERSTYPDIEMMDDSAGLDTVSEMEPAVERDKDDEKRGKTEKGKEFYKDSIFTRVKSFFFGAFFLFYGVMLILDDDVEGGTLVIIIAVMFFLSSIFLKKIRKFFSE
jgi:hypothetical protein